MATNTRTVAGIVSMALRNLGEDEISIAEAATPTLRRSKIAMGFYDEVRDATLHEHPWSFALERATLYAYQDPATTITPGAVSGSTTFTAGTTGIFGLRDVGREIWNTTSGSTGKATITALSETEPAASLQPGATSGVGITFTASAAVFLVGDIGKVIYNQAGHGEARITGFTDTTHVVATITEAFPDTNPITSGSWGLVRTDLVTATITEAFPSTSAIASGSWRLYYPFPAYQFAYSIPLPDDALRIWRLDDNTIEHRVESGYIVTDETELDLVYVRQETDVTKYSYPFVQALVAHLTAILAKPITGQLQATDLWMKVYGQRLAVAKALNGMEGTPEEVETNILTDLRR